MEFEVDLFNWHFFFFQLRYRKKTFEFTRLMSWQVFMTSHMIIDDISSSGTMHYSLVSTFSFANNCHVTVSLQVGPTGPSELHFRWLEHQQTNAVWPVRKLGFSNRIIHSQIEFSRHIEVTWAVSRSCDRCQLITFSRETPPKFSSHVDLLVLSFRASHRMTFLGGFLHLRSGCFHSILININYLSYSSITFHLSNVSSYFKLASHVLL